MRDEASPLWLMEHDPGPTGDRLRRLPPDWKAAIRASCENACPELNPWSALKDQAESDGMRRLYASGESQWRTLSRLARIRTGAASMRTDWPIGSDSKRARRKVASHWLGWDLGEQYWKRMLANVPSPGFNKHFEEDADHHRTETAKRRSIRPRRLPEWEERIDRVVCDLVLGWMAFGIGGIPGFCFWSDRATAQFFAVAANRNALTEGWIRKTTARLGLIKEGFVWVSSVEVTDDDISLITQDRKERMVLPRR